MLTSAWYPYQCGEGRRFSGCSDGEGRTEGLVNGALTPIRDVRLPGRQGCAKEIDEWLQVCALP